MKREIPTAVFVIIIVAVLLIAGILFWRASGPRGEVVLEKAEKPYPAPPIFQQKPPGAR